MKWKKPTPEKFSGGNQKQGAGTHWGAAAPDVGSYCNLHRNLTTLNSVGNLYSLTSPEGLRLDAATNMKSIKYFMKAFYD